MLWVIALLLLLSHKWQRRARKSVDFLNIIYK